MTPGSQSTSSAHPAKEGQAPLEALRLQVLLGFQGFFLFRDFQSVEGCAFFCAVQGFGV